MQTPAPIGIFDSGYGGLTVFREIRAKLSRTRNGIFEKLI
jgi:glutamate racemase